MSKNLLCASMFYLIVLSCLNFSCTTSSSKVKNKSLESEITFSDGSIKDHKIGLAFTSGISSILEDCKGNFWLGSHQEGVCSYDGEKFTYFTTEGGLSDNQIISILEDQNGNIWFNTGKGISSYNGEKIINHSKDIINDVGGILSNEWHKSDKDLWFSAGHFSGVYRYDGKNIHYLEFPKVKHVNPTNVYHATGFSKGKNNQIWIATYAGVFGYNGKEFTIINDESLGYNKDHGFLHIRSILEDSKGRLWIGNNGIGVLLHEADSTINFSQKHGLIHFNSSKSGDPSPPNTLEHVFAINEDSKGNIWFGDRDTGAWKYDGKTMTNYTVDDKLKSQMIWSIYIDKSDDLLVTMAEGGVYKFNGASFDRLF